ncbi:MAG TPA: hypothetical protein PLV92_01905 [Pirellulaceae bacterium]|nr:hypothetical protein [Pirellulaceae bacterium]
MAKKPRRELIDESRVGTYHCFTQAVRQAFLMGDGSLELRDLSHRQRWVRDRIEALSSVFAVDVGDYAAMSNHMHLILRNRPDVAASWSDEEVARRWLLLNRHNLELNRPARAEKIASVAEDRDRVEKYRRRLSSISWFMAYLKQPIANEANLEDKKHGHFWADRFGSVELQDEEARLACLLYVDLNRVRAGEAKVPESAEFTGIYDRMRDRLERVEGRPHSGWLVPLSFSGDGYEGAVSQRRASDLGMLSMAEDVYLELLDREGREKRPGKRGWIAAELPPILERLRYSAANWERAVRITNRRFERLQQKADEQANREPRREARSDENECGPTGAS